MNFLLRTSRIDIATIHWMNNCFKERELSSIIYLFCKRRVRDFKNFFTILQKKKNSLILVKLKSVYQRHELGETFELSRRVIHTWRSVIFLFVNEHECICIPCNLFLFVPFICTFYRTCYFSVYVHVSLYTYSYDTCIVLSCRVPLELIACPLCESF